MSKSKFCSCLGIVIALAGAVVASLTEQHIGGSAIAVAGSVLAALGKALGELQGSGAAVVLLALGVTGEGTACSGAAPNLPTKADWTAYSFDEGVCLETEQTKAEWRTCVTQARATFCVKFPAVCPADGGAE